MYRLDTKRSKKRTAEATKIRRADDVSQVSRLERQVSQSIASDTVCRRSLRALPAGVPCKQTQLTVHKRKKWNLNTKLDII